MLFRRFPEDVRSRLRNPYSFAGICGNWFCAPI